MLDSIEKLFRDLIFALQIAKLYTVRHARFNLALDRLYDSLQHTLLEKEPLVLGIIDEELAFEKEIFLDLSKTAKGVILYLKERGIEKIVFQREVEREELRKFIEFLTTAKDEIKIGPEEYLSLSGIKHISVGKILTSEGAPPSEEEMFKALHNLSLYQDSTQKITEALEKVMNNEAVDYLNLRFTLTNIMEGLVSRRHEILTLATIKRYDLSTFMHSLNVSILAMYFSSQLGFSKDDVLDIGIASLFHDLGKLYISRRIIKKKEQLSDEEFAAMKSHVVLGAEMLFQYVDSLGELPALVAFEHHLKFNLAGYPKLSFPRVPHTASLIVCICDVYDALSARRNYKNDYPPDMIYDIMIKERGTTFEPRLLDAFFRAMGVWPLGSIVELSDGRSVVVREENESNIFLPKVEVIIPQEERGKSINLTDYQGQLKIAKFLNPWKEGKDLLKLIGVTSAKSQQAAS